MKRCQEQGGFLTKILKVLFLVLLLNNIFLNLAYAGTYTPLAYPGASETYAHGINNMGHVVGVYVDSSEYVEHGFLYDGFTYTTLDYPGAIYTYAQGINDAGHIVGWYADTHGNNHGFLYDGFTYTTLDFRSTPNCDQTEAYGINNFGQIVGWHRYQSCSGGLVNPFHGFLYNGSTYIRLDYPGTISTYAQGINDVGQIVGLYCPYGSCSSFLYDGSNYIRMDNLGPAYGINNLGHVVGIEYNSNYGFLYDGSTYIRLDYPEADLTEAYGINNFGQIVGWYRSGNIYNGFLYTPDTTPPITVPDAPTEIIAIAGNSQAIVSFSVPASNGSDITSYTVTSDPGNIISAGASSPITVTGLTNGISYTFTVTAMNAIGKGPASAPSNIVTPGDVPDAPTGVLARPGYGQATISFSAPASDGGSAITFYTITSNPENISTVGSSSPLTVAGLTNGVPYTFVVTASNAIGTGPASEPSNSVTPTFIPVPYGKVHGLFIGVNYPPKEGESSSLLAGDQAIWLSDGFKTSMSNYFLEVNSRSLTIDLAGGLGLQGSDVEEYIKTFSSGIGPNDYFVLYIGGHGWSPDDWNLPSANSWIRVGRETLLGGLVDDDLNPGNYFKSNQLKDVLSLLPATSAKWIFIDACSSEGFLQSIVDLHNAGVYAAAQYGKSAYWVSGLMPGYSEQMVPPYSLLFGDALYAAFAPNPTSAAADTDPNSLGVITFKEVEQYVLKTYREYAAVLNGNPTPVAIYEAGLGDPVSPSEMIFSPVFSQTEDFRGMLGLSQELWLKFTGFLFPIGGADATGGSSTDPIRAFKLGGTIPVKMLLINQGTPVTTGTHKLQLSKVSNSTTPDTPIDATPTDAITTGNAFRLTDEWTGEWHFNLSTKALSKGIWRIKATLSDGSTHIAFIELK